jgi:hypothetical protein
MNQIPQNPFGQGGTFHGGAMPVLILVAIVAAISYLCAVLAYRRYTGLTYGQSVKIWACAIGLTIASLIFLSTKPANGDMKPFITISMCNILLFLIATPFGVQLYRKWIGDHLTEAEKLPGIDGVRAWLGVGNVICAVLIPLCVQGTFEPVTPIYQPVTLIPLLFGLLLAYPLLNIASHSAQPTPVAPAEDLSKEREKVLQLLETGKISAADSAELLNALTHSAPPPAKPAAEINTQRKLVLLGAALLLLGFFLPWFSINPGAMVNEMATELQQNMRQNMNQMMPGNALPANMMPQVNLSVPTGTVQVHAGDIPHGLGWWILMLGIAAAVLPFFATTLESSMQKKIILVALGIGAILFIYLLSDNIKYVSFGILLALAGYVLEVLGTLKERPLAR